MQTQTIFTKGFLLREKKVLLLKRSSQKSTNPEKYELPGGQLEYAESVERSLLRVYQEHTGLIVEPFVPFHTASQIDDEKQIQNIVIYYIVDETHSGEEVITSEDYSEHMWADIQDLDQLYSEQKITDAEFTATKLGLQLAHESEEEPDEDPDHN